MRPDVAAASATPQIATRWIHQDDLLTLVTELVENPRGHGVFHMVSETIEAEAIARLVETAAQVSKRAPEHHGHVKARGLASSLGGPTAGFLRGFWFALDAFKPRPSRAIFSEPSRDRQAHTTRGGQPCPRTPRKSPPKKNP